MQNYTTNKIKVQPPLLHPKLTNIGYGNPRYNSMLVSDYANVLLPCGSALRKIDIKNGVVVASQQIGYSQIFQIIQNDLYYMVVSFEGLITLLTKNDLQPIKQFYAPGKQIRHSSITQKYITFSAELNEGTKETQLLVYKIQDILKEGGLEVSPKPIYSRFGYYYYAECVDEVVHVIQFDDPNPKGKSRTQTVMEKKLPIKHKILTLSLDTFALEEIHDIEFKGQILSCCTNPKTKQIFYMHEGKHITLIDGGKCYEFEIETTSNPHCAEPFDEGIIFASKSKELSYFVVKEGKQTHTKQTIKSSGVGGNLSIKTLGKDLYLFNENGLHFYEASTSKTYSHFCFDITNCGLSLNANGSMLTVGDFGGNIYTFPTQGNLTLPLPITKATIGIPIRTLTWCHDTNKILIGCVGGGLYAWDGFSEECEMLSQFDHTINILRYFDGYVYMGTSDGFVHVFHSQTLQKVYLFQAHFPIQYETKEQRQLFGSMKNYAQIWSIIVYPGAQNEYKVVTSSEDQTEKVFSFKIASNAFSHELQHHLKGHQLAVTSVDWKVMGKGIGPLYVSCSDDKVIRFRNPLDGFSILHEVETSTIKEWHTLTYLSLQPEGHRVAVGSQNGYLFIYDIEKRELVFGEKIHLGGIEGMDWRNNRLVTCSSDLCLNVIDFD